MKNKTLRMIAMIVMSSTLLISILGFSACDFIKLVIRVPSFEEKCITTKDGFVYYVDDNIGLCIIDIPKTEKVHIPEYIDGNKVVQMGYKDSGIGYMYEYFVDGGHIKELTVEHTVFYKYVSSFPKLEKVVYIDFPYCQLDFDNMRNTVRVPNYENATIVELKKSNRQLDINNFKFKTIEIPEYVTVIEAGVFDGIEGVTLKTPYNQQPDGWENGWSGDCTVEWGTELE